MSDLATVDCLPGQNWNAHAVLGDALQRAPIDAMILVLWIDKDGVYHRSSSATNAEIVWACALATKEALGGG